VTTQSPFAVDVASGLEALERADTIIVPGFRPLADPPRHVLDALREAHARGARIASACGPDGQARGDAGTQGFARKFRARSDLTPVRWLAVQRLLAAQRLLESTRLSVEDIAERTGLGIAANLRVHMGRRLGTTPTAYRRKLRSAGKPLGAS
jgi:transcriptional regulator GlxA family with amidase domain